MRLARTFLAFSLLVAGCTALDETNSPLVELDNGLNRLQTRTRANPFYRLRRKRRNLPGEDTNACGGDFSIFQAMTEASCEHTPHKAPLVVTLDFNQADNLRNFLFAKHLPGLSLVFKFVYNLLCIRGSEQGKVFWLNKEYKQRKTLMPKDIAEGKARGLTGSSLVDVYYHDEPGCPCTSVHVEVFRLSAGSLKWKHLPVEDPVCKLPGKTHWKGMDVTVDEWKNECSARALAPPTRLQYMQLRMQEQKPGNLRKQAIFKCMDKRFGEDRF